MKADVWWVAEVSPTTKDATLSPQHAPTLQSLLRLIIFMKPLGEKNQQTECPSISMQEWNSISRTSCVGNK